MIEKTLSDKNIDEFDKSKLSGGLAASILQLGHSAQKSSEHSASKNKQTKKLKYYHPITGILFESQDMQRSNAMAFKFKDLRYIFKHKKNLSFIVKTNENEESAT